MINSYDETQSPLEKFTPERNLYLGIDPGASGGIAILDDRGAVVIAVKMPDTAKDIFEVMEEFAPRVTMATLEKVGPMPKQGISSTAKFMRHYGLTEGLLIALRCPYSLVRPQEWQSVMHCLTKGDKNVSKAKAQGLFPQLKITHATADALLIAEYTRRHAAVIV